MGLINWGNFKSHSGLDLAFKLDCDLLTKEDLDSLARIVVNGVPRFNRVVGVPTGSIRFAESLEPYKCGVGTRTLIVDDVLTTGASMTDAKYKQMGHNCVGVVIFARRKPDKWIRSI